jgi:hypothetical protein
MCVYQANDKRGEISFPKVLLFDEVDAYLHPSMAKHYLRTIKEILIDKHGVNVIATTHSPSTVALAPEEALWAMNVAEPRLRKVTLPEALNLLTVDVPTLALDYTAQRQVFVESEYDACIYTDIYRMLKSALNSERSLQFIHTGAKSSGGSDINTGCDIVRRIVTDLNRAGNQSVFGLLDWDNSRSAGGRIFILAQGRRNGLENCFFDPLLLAATLVKEGQHIMNYLGIQNQVTFREFCNFSPPELQPITEYVQRQVLKNSTGEGKFVAVGYQGGFKLQLYREYLMMDDHALEAAVKAAFPHFKDEKRFGKERFKQHIVRGIAREQPNFLPIEFFEVFKAILCAPSHIRN